MSENILIATLGDHPTAVTAMVKALREIEQIQVDTLYVLHPEDSGKDIAALGYPLIEEHLRGHCQVQSVPLPFGDCNTLDHAMTFLQILSGLLEQYRDPVQYRVYLSLAGGRKSTSALLALVAQFFPSVQGLYHLIDRFEDSRTPSFPSIEDLVLSLSGAQEALDPPVENLNLVPVPYPGAFADADRLRQFLRNPQTFATAGPIPLSVEAEAFFRAVFHSQRVEQQLEVWLSETAVKQFERAGTEDAARFWLCFLQMRSPLSLQAGLHHRVGDLLVYKRSHRQRPLYYTTPNDIEGYPEKPVERVIVCGLSIEYAGGYTGPYDPTLAWQHEHAQRQPHKRLSELRSRDRTLLVPLGKSPMVVTQTYALLLRSEEEGCPRIPTVAVVYPERHSQIRDSVRLLNRQFERKGVTLIPYPIPGSRDVDSPEACQAYLGTVLSAIEKLQRDYPDQQIALSLSGGRKEVSALTLLAAQRSGIEQVYHTLVSDVELEKRVEKEARLDALNALATDEARARRLFLDEYGSQHFELFTVPVIPWKLTGGVE